MNACCKIALSSLASEVVRKANLGSPPRASASSFRFVLPAPLSNDPPPVSCSSPPPPNNPPHQFDSNSDPPLFFPLSGFPFHLGRFPTPLPRASLVLMGQPFKEYLTAPRIYCCSICKAHAAAHDQIFAKSFNGRFGRAYLFNSVVNVCIGPREDRMLMTGLHTVNDIHCSSCYQILGWKYEKAYDEKEKYKEGKYIMEKARMTKENQ